VRCIPTANPVGEHVPRHDQVEGQVVGPELEVVSHKAEDREEGDSGRSAVGREVRDQDAWIRMYGSGCMDQDVWIRMYGCMDGAGNCSGEVMADCSMRIKL
jgi:hypothetical protein